MNRPLFYTLHAVFLPWAFMASVFYLLILCPLFIIVNFCRSGGDFRRTMCAHNRFYGRYMLRIAAPFIRTRRYGTEHMPMGTCLVVCNHRSTLDVFFCSLVPRSDITIFTRHWPRKLPLLGWYMRAAGYLDMESLDQNALDSAVRPVIERSGVLLAFPEGHRTRDGKLQPFKSGAFRIATQYDLPVVPVCITGGEHIMTPGQRLPRPGKVCVEILQGVRPADFPEEKRALKLRRAVEHIFREHLGEA